MTRKSLLLLVASTLIFGAMSAAANDGPSRGFSGHDGWRLGEPVRGGYAIYRHTGRGWYRVPGAAIQIADGWALGAGRESGGYAIYRWNGHDWDQAPGGAVRIGGSYQQPWVVNNRGQRFIWNGYDWRPEFNAFRGRNDHFGWPQDVDRQHRDRDRPRNDFRFEHRGDSGFQRLYRGQGLQREQPRYRRGGRW